MEAITQTQRLNTHLINEEIDVLKNKLLSEKERILNKDLIKNNYKLDRNELFDPVDEASENLQRSQELRFRTRENIFLKKINKALGKLNRGEYGICEECDSEISFVRLAARITAQKCIECKEAEETDEKHNFKGSRSKSLGKTIQELSHR
jgi:DnaK suppressor protein